MFCIHCGAENLDGARFCVSCGQNVQASKPGGRAGSSPTLDAAETEMGLSVGQTLGGRFEVRRLVGAGGMGRVYLAKDHVLERPVALKVLRDLLSRDTGSVRRLVEEAKAAIRLAHPNIVRVDDYHDAGTVKFLAMEYVDGQTLTDRIEAGLDEQEARRIAVEICKGLEHAHANRVIHRDLKPGNILLGRDGSVKIADFGIARVARDSVSRLGSQQDSGTLLYMAPEQLLGKSSEASDIYSLGVVLYEMISGDPPFSSGDISYQIREVAPQPPRGASAPLAATVLKCLRKSPAERFATVRELREELEMATGVRQADVAVQIERLPERRPDVAGPPVSTAPGSTAASAPGTFVDHASQQHRVGKWRSVGKHALLGAVGFGGITIPAAPLIYEGAQDEIRVVFFVCPVVAGLLGPILLKLKRPTVVVFGLVSLALAVMLQYPNITRGDIEDAVPFLVCLFLAGGAAFGAFVGYKRRGDGLAAAPK